MAGGRGILFFTKSLQSFLKVVQAMLDLMFFGRCGFVVTRGLALLTILQFFPHLEIVILTTLAALKSFVGMSDLRKRDLNASQLHAFFAMKTVRMKKLCHRKVRSFDVRQRCGVRDPKNVVECFGFLDTLEILFERKRHIRES